MSKIKVTETGIEGLKIIEPKVVGDNRGYFMETYQKNEFIEAGIDLEFVQDNQSKSRKGVLRGMHMQLKYPQGKIVRVNRGEVYDVAVDLRRESPTYRKWFGICLSEENKKMFYVPPGFGHGFLVLSDEAEFIYKCTDYYHPEDEIGFIWNDPGIGIDWMLDRLGGEKVSLSEKDSKLGYWTD